MRVAQPRIRNFGRNLDFTPRELHFPKDERELLTLLHRNRDSAIRVVASRHAWSAGIESGEVLLDLKRVRHIRIHERAGGFSVSVGAGCKIKDLLAALNARGLTLPAIGLITEQTVAGATSTGTHGSGRQSLSHFIQALRIACYDPTGETARVVEINAGEALRAARCALGCLGVVVELTFPCVPQYLVRPGAFLCRTVHEALASESRAPLQHFFLLPQSWDFFVQTREVVSEGYRPLSAALYRAYWFLTVDLGMHLVMKAAASVLRSKSAVRLLYRKIFPPVLARTWGAVDRSDRALTMEHELFRHLEMELFVQRAQVVEAADYVREVLRFADDAECALSEATRARLEEVGFASQLAEIGGRFTHHYPICFRRILPDDTLISMASGPSEDWYSISFITYVEPRAAFFDVAGFLGRSMGALFGARPHWGKWFPQSAAELERLYPHLERFRAQARQHDPRGMFRNKFTAEKLGLRRGVGDKG